MTDDIEIAQSDEIVIHSNEIEAALLDACEELGIKDLLSEKLGRWKAALSIVGNRLFKPSQILRQKDAIYPTTYGGRSNLNAWDYDKVNELCDYYLFLSNKYNKVVSIEAFSCLSGICKGTIETWKSHDVAKTSFCVWKKLNEAREVSIADKMLDSSSIVGSIAVANREYQWNSDLQTGKTVDKDRLTLEDTLKDFEQFKLEHKMN